jgi:hypothetical protein
LLLDEVVDDVVEDDGAVVPLVVDVEGDVDVPVLVSVDELVVVDADVSAVVELDVVVDWPQAAMAIRAPAAAKLRIKRILSSSRKLGTRRHRR